jgi:hypothetical protein
MVTWKRLKKRASEAHKLSMDEILIAIAEKLAPYWQQK